MSASAQPLSAAGWSLPSARPPPIGRRKRGISRHLSRRKLWRPAPGRAGRDVAGRRRGPGGDGSCANRSTRVWPKAILARRPPWAPARRRGAPCRASTPGCSVNRVDDPERAGMAASLSALIFGASKKIGVIHVGDCRVYRKRQGVAGGADRRSSAAGRGRRRAHARLRGRHGCAGRFPGRGRRNFRPFHPGQSRLCRAFEACAPEPVAVARSRRGAFGAARRRGGGLRGDRCGHRHRGASPSRNSTMSAPPMPNCRCARRRRRATILDGFLVGRTLYRSRYTLLKLARDTTDNRQVVLKFPLPAMAQDQVFRAGFLREAWIGATVRSRWTVGYIDLPPERRRSLYLVMPYYRGQTLEQRLLTPAAGWFCRGCRHRPRTMSAQSRIC